MNKNITIILSCSYTKSISGISLPCPSGYKHSDSTINVVNIPSGNSGSENMEVVDKIEIRSSKVKKNKRLRIHTREEFWKYVNKKDKNECWNWSEDTTHHGYGILRFNNKFMYAHRLSYILTYGEIPKDKPNICHKCNNPRCCNPNHLFSCTQKENLEQMSNEGRSLTGEKQPTHVKTWEEIHKIRELHHKGYSQEKLSKMFGISLAAISLIITNKRWKDSNYKYEYRTGQEGENSHKAKLTWKEVNEIRKLWMTGSYTQNQIAKIFNVSKSAIKHIVNNETWKDNNYIIPRW